MEQKKTERKGRNNSVDTERITPGGGSLFYQPGGPPANMGPKKSAGKNALNKGANNPPEIELDNDLIIRERSNSLNIKKPGIITVYHGCHLDSVKHILKGIVYRDLNDASDFTAKSETRGFYTYRDLAFAQEWALVYPHEKPAVMKFEFDTSGLRVYDFGPLETGEQYERWQKFVYRNYEECAPEHPGLHDNDVIIGFMSNADELDEQGRYYDKDKPLSATEYAPKYSVIGDKRPLIQVTARTTKASEAKRWKFITSWKFEKEKGTSGKGKGKWVQVGWKLKGDQWVGEVVPNSKTVKL